MADIPKLDLKSKDIAADKQAKLKALFPEIFTEGDKIDFDKLRLTLGDSIDANDERFGLHWAGKKECFSIIQEPSIGTLKPAKDESVNWDNTENLFIEGDNLEVLKLLQKSYYGKVKMIYIDPPYNTGGEFIYPDKYQENLDTYLAYTGQIDDDGYKFSTNAETEGRYHSNWLNMMYPRLFLARNLLKHDGVIFISIDNNEVDNLKKICDEIFGEENRIEILSWKNKYGSGAATKGFIEVHEYILVYSKNPISKITSELNESERKKYIKTDEKFEKRGGYRTQPLATRSLGDRPNLVYPIPYKGTEILPDKQWVWSKERMFKAIENNDVEFTEKNGKYSINAKKYIKDENGEIRRGTPISLLNGPFNQEGTKEIRQLFNGKNPFDFVKPSALIRQLINIEINNEKDEEHIVIDFFAGSCTTAHSVLDLNAQYGSSRKFIMVQLPEPIDEKSQNFKDGYKTIADIGKERIRRVIKKIETEKQVLEKEFQTKKNALSDLQAEKARTPKLFENGKSKDLTDLETSIEVLKTKIANIESTDLGFKVFKLDKSNFKVWDGAVENDVPKQIEMAINHLEPDSKEFDILFEILLKAGFELTLPIKELTLADKKVYSVEDDALLICLENELNEDVIRAIAAKEPARFVCLDTGFKDNDQLKTNAVQIMKSHNIHDFKTV